MLSLVLATKEDIPKDYSNSTLIGEQHLATLQHCLSHLLS